MTLQRKTYQRSIKGVICKLKCIYCMIVFMKQTDTKYFHRIYIADVQLSASFRAIFTKYLSLHRTSEKLELTGQTMTNIFFKARSSCVRYFLMFRPRFHTLTHIQAISEGKHLRKQYLSPPIAVVYMMVKTNPVREYYTIHLCSLFWACLAGTDNFSIMTFICPFHSSLRMPSIASRAASIRGVFQSCIFAFSWVIRLRSRIWNKFSNSRTSIVLVLKLEYSQHKVKQKKVC